MFPPTTFEQHAVSAPAVVIQGLRIIPEASVLTVRLPFGSFVWNRPRAVLVEQAGEVKRFPITDVTRLAQMAIWACALLSLCKLRIAAHNRKESAQ
jgi:hypothetical protein